MASLISSIVILEFNPADLWCIVTVFFQLILSPKLLYDCENLPRSLCQDPSQWATSSTSSAKRSSRIIDPLTLVFDLIWTVAIIPMCNERIKFKSFYGQPSFLRTMYTSSLLTESKALVRLRTVLFISEVKRVGNTVGISKFLLLEHNGYIAWASGNFSSNGHRELPHRIYHSLHRKIHTFWKSVEF